MKNYKVLMIVNIVLIVYIFALSIGYAFFSESLTVDGIASTVEFYEGENLPVSSIVRDSSNNYYFTSSFDSGYLLSYKSETWQDDTYVLNIDKSLLLAYEGKEITYTISFSNPTVLNYTNGYISTEVIGENSDIVSTTGALSSVEVAPGGAADVSFTIRVDDFNQSNTSAKATITYTLQNKPRYLYFVINYKAADYVNLFNQDSMIESSYVTKTDEGYKFLSNSINWGNDSQMVMDLKANLKAGVTYELIRDYQGIIDGSGGFISITDGNVGYVNLGTSLGIGKVNFTLTQEQIDSIDKVFINGGTNGKGIYKYIIIREVK